MFRCVPGGALFEELVSSGGSSRINGSDADNLDLAILLQQKVSAARGQDDTYFIEKVGKRDFTLFKKTIENGKGKCIAVSQRTHNSSFLYLHMSLRQNSTVKSHCRQYEGIFAKVVLTPKY